MALGWVLSRRSHPVGREASRESVKGGAGGSRTLGQGSQVRSREPSPPPVVPEGPASGGVFAFRRRPPFGQTREAPQSSGRLPCLPIERSELPPSAVEGTDQPVRAVRSSPGVVPS